MLPPNHCSMGTMGLNISFLFSTHGKNFCILRCQTVAHCQLQLTEVFRIDRLYPSKQIGQIFIFDGGEGFSFYPFAEMVGCNQQQLLMSWDGR